MKTSSFLVPALSLCVPLLAATAHAGPRSSTNYHGAAESVGGGGNRATSAAQLLDDDGDGQNNQFEFTAGLVPTDPLPRFSLTIIPVPGQPTQKEIIFDPLVAVRSYTVMTRPDLTSESWAPLTGSTTSDAGGQRTISDSAATATQKFHTVEIGKP